MRSTRHSLSDVLDGETVMPGVIDQLAAGHPIYYRCDDAGCYVEERPDGSIWRVEFGPGGSLRYLDDRPIS